MWAMVELPMIGRVLHAMCICCIQLGFSAVTIECSCHATKQSQQISRFSQAFSGSTSQQAKIGLSSPTQVVVPASLTAERATSGSWQLEGDSKGHARTLRGAYESDE